MRGTTEPSSWWLSLLFHLGCSLGREIVFWILLFFTLTYVFVSLGDTIADLRFVFDRRLVRRYLARFSLRTLFWGTSVAAVFFAAAHRLEVPPGQWGLLALGIAFIAVLGLTIRIALADITFRGWRRRYPARYDRHHQPHQAPGIRQ